MFVVDANVLLYAVNKDAQQHEAASTWLKAALEGGETVGFAWVVALAFLRLSTHPNLFPHPLDPDQATGALETWMAAPPSLSLEPTTRHLPILSSLLASEGRGGNIVNDAHLATLALEHGASVVSFDRDFARFEGVAVVRPEG